jgi:hypothetical protein
MGGGLKVCFGSISDQSRMGGLWQIGPFLDNLLQSMIGGGTELGLHFQDHLMRALTRAKVRLIRTG